MTHILAMQELATESHTDDEMPCSCFSWSHCDNTN